MTLFQPVTKAQPRILAQPRKIPLPTTRDPLLWTLAQIGGHASRSDGKVRLSVEHINRLSLNHQTSNTHLSA